MKLTTIDRAKSDFAELCRSAESYGVPVRNAMVMFSSHLAAGQLSDAMRQYDDLIIARNAARIRHQDIVATRLKRAAEIGLALLLAAGLAYGFLTA